MGERLKSKKALVLGVAPGNVGAAIAERYVEQGASVMIADRHAEALEQVAAAIGTEWQALERLCDRPST